MTALERATAALTGDVWVRGTATPYGRRAGYPTLPWDGAFVDCMLFDAGLRGTPSFVNPAMAFAALAVNREVPRRPAAGDIVLTSFGTVGVLDGLGKNHATVIAGDQRAKDREGAAQVRRLSLTRQDILLHGRPRGIPSVGSDAPSASQIRSNPERFLRGALQAHPYTRGLGPVPMSSALYRWAMICGARPEDAAARRYRDEYLLRLGLESGYFGSGALR